jgi:HEAT repeat protein
MDENPQPVAELFQRANLTKDVEEYLTFLCVLHAHGNREVFDVAVRYSQSKVAAERALAADVLGQLGWDKLPFLEERLQILLNLLKDKRACVLNSAGIGLGHLKASMDSMDLETDPRMVPPLVALKNHWSGSVRYSVAFALCGLDDDQTVQTLIELSEDEQIIVRDWATTGLAGIDLDMPEIREALVRRLDDPDEITAREAREGLARRGCDPPPTPPVA